MKRLLTILPIIILLTAKVLCAQNKKADWILEDPHAEWQPRDSQGALAMSIVFKNKMWMMGGWYNGQSGYLRKGPYIRTTGVTGLDDDQTK